MTKFTLVTLNMEHGNKNPYEGRSRGNLLCQSNPDVIFIQESCPSRIIMDKHYQLLNFSNINNSYKMDQSERMDIYINSESSWKLHHQFQIDNLPQKSPRQSKIIILKNNLTQRQIILANVHLVGGRYDENDNLGGMLKLELSELRNVKNEILKKLVSQYQVDLIAGDFNSDLNCYLQEGVLSSSQLSFFQNVSPGKSLQTYQEWNLSPYNYLYSQDYQLSTNVSKDSVPVYTSIYKNHPDSIWFKKSLGKILSYNILDFLTPNLSDHNGLQITLEIP